MKMVSDIVAIHSALEKVTSKVWKSSAWLAMQNDIIPYYAFSAVHCILN